MDYDPIRSCVTATAAELETLSSLVAAGADPAVVDTWLEAGLVATEPGDDEQSTLIHPTLAGIASLLGRPDRTITIERFAAAADGGHVDVIVVAWDRHNRCIITEGVGDDRLLVTASQMKLLPALLSQALRINPDSLTSELPAVSTTAAAVAAVFDPKGKANTTTEGLEFVAHISHAWRATASWVDQGTDSWLTVFHSAAEGFWSLGHNTAVGEALVPDTLVELSPLGPAEVLHRLGQVITGSAATAGNQVAVA